MLDNDLTWLADQKFESLEGLAEICKELGSWETQTFRHDSAEGDDAAVFWNNLASILEGQGRNTEPMVSLRLAGDK